MAQQLALSLRQSLSQRRRGEGNLYDTASNWSVGKGLESNLGQQGWFVPQDIPGLIMQLGKQPNKDWSVEQSK